MLTAKTRTASLILLREPDSIFLRLERLVSQDLCLSSLPVRLGRTSLIAVDITLCTMDTAAVLRALRACEEVPLEARNYRGLTVGQLWRAWPEEVLTGRCSGRSQTPHDKFVQVDMILT